MILLIYASAGAGHKHAARSLQEELIVRGVGESTEILDSISLTPRWFSKLYTGSYWFLANHIPSLWLFFFWLLNLQCMHRIDLFLKKHFPSGTLKSLERFFIQKNPKHLVFTHFLGISNAVELRKKGAIRAVIRAVVTDFYAHALWIHEGIDEYCVMSEETREDMMRKWRIPGNKIRVTGIPVSEKFSESEQKKDPSFLETLGLERNRFTILFTSGAFGYGPTESWLKALSPLATKVQAIVVCGNNTPMKERLEQIKWPFPTRVMGFVTNMNELMDVSRIVVAKPGGITTCEALVKSVPMIISSVIPGQEQGNLDLLKRHDACWHLSSAKDFFELVKSILENPEVLESKKKNLAALAKPHSTQDIVDLILAT